MKNEHFEGRGITLNSLLEEREALNMRMLLALQLRDLEAQEALRRIVAAFPEELRQEARNCLADTLKGVLTQQLLPVSGVEAQTAAFEGLCPDSEMRALVREGRMGQIASLMEMREDSMAHTMDGAILSCYMKSQISSKTALLYAADRERMQQRMRIY